MFKLKTLKILIPIVLLALIICFSYTYFLKDFYLNNSSQSIHLRDFSNQKALELKKHKEQKNIYSLEIEINGNSDEPLLLVYGPSLKSITNQIMLKQGDIDFVTVTDWYQDNCFMFITSENGEKVDLVIDYRFIGSSN